MELVIKEVPRDLSSSLSNQITYLKGERDVILRKQSELQTERDKVGTELAKAHRTQLKHRKQKNNKME